jgi:antibiotic biosynthesis monooxygenase
VFARTTIVQGDPTKLEEGIAQVRDQVMPAVTGMDGCVGMSMLCDRSSGRCIVTTAWESEDAMSASAPMVAPMREQATRTLDAATSDVMMWEIAAVHRDHWVPDGACARVTWLSGRPEIADRAVDMFRMAVLPRVQEFDGFCAASFMVDRAAGRAVGAVVFDSRESLEASREATTRIRERVTQEMGATVDAVEEMEVAFAHLHVPEMA